MKTNKVAFDKIKPGAFFRMTGKTLYQRGRCTCDDVGQYVTGPKTGQCRDGCDGLTLSTLVTPVNAKIVEEK